MDLFPHAFCKSIIRKEGIAPVEFVSQTPTSPTLSYALQSLALRKPFQAPLRLPCAKKGPLFEKRGPESFSNSSRV